MVSRSPLDVPLSGEQLNQKASSLIEYSNVSTPEFQTWKVCAAACVPWPQELLRNVGLNEMTGPRQTVNVTPTAKGELVAPGALIVIVAG
jgi:hypothetical protein